MSNAVTEMAEGVQQRIRDLAYLMWESAGRQHDVPPVVLDTDLGKIRETETRSRR